VTIPAAYPAPVTEEGADSELAPDSRFIAQND